MASDKVLLVLDIKPFLESGVYSLPASALGKPPWFFVSILLSPKMHGPDDGEPMSVGFARVFTYYDVLRKSVLGLEESLHRQGVQAGSVVLATNKTDLSEIEKVVPVRELTALENAAQEIRSGN